MNPSFRPAPVLGPGIGLGLAGFVVTTAVLLLIAPPAIPYVVDAVVSFVLLAFAFAVLGVGVAAYVEEARRQGPRVPVWLGVSTGASIGVATLVLCAATSLFPVIPVLAVRVLMILGLAASVGVLAAVVLVDRLAADGRREAVVQDAPSILNDAMSSLEEAMPASGERPEAATRLRRLLERHRSAIQPMAHVTTAVDASLEDAVSRAVALLKEPEGDAAAAGELAAALRSVELFQEKRIAMQVRRG